MPTNANLRVLLEEVEADPVAGTFRIGVDEIDTTETYFLNCKESPAKHLIILPGFGSMAIQRDYLGALEKFKNFCRSQLGQRMRAGGHPFLLVVTKEVKPLATSGVLSTTETLLSHFTAKTTQTDFNEDRAWGCDYLTFSAGEKIVELPSPEEADGWSFGILKNNMQHGWFPPTYVA